MSEFTDRTYWNPYSKRKEPVLTDEEVQAMWPYNKKDPKAQYVPDPLLDDCMPTIVPKSYTDKKAAKAVEGHDRSGPMGAMADMEFFPVADEKVVKKALHTANLGEAMLANIETAEARLDPDGQTTAPTDMVNLPSHYARFKIEPMRFIVENLGPGFLIGNIIKYTMRYDAKNGLEDLRKARRCQDMLIAYVEGDPDWWKVKEKS